MSHTKGEEKVGKIIGWGLQKKGEKTRRRETSCAYDESAVEPE